MKTPKRQIRPATALPQVHDMLYKLAWRYAHAHGLDFNECMSEVYYGFMKACKRFNPKKKTKFSTLCYLIGSYRLRTMVMKRAQDKLVFLEHVGEDLLGAAPDQHSESLGMIEDLSEDAREIINLLVDTPAELLEDAPRGVSRLLGRVKQYMVRNGRSRAQVNQAHEELTARFKLEWAI